jgi:hypothetical protein
VNSKSGCGTGKLLDGESIDAKVYFRQLTDIDANEGSFIGCDKPFKQEFIYASAQKAPKSRSPPTRNKPESGRRPVGK